MKHFIFILLFLSSVYANGNSEIGKTLYQTFFKDELGYIGDDFTAKYTAKEWEALFEDDARGLKEKFGVTQNLREFFRRDDIDTFLPHLKAFAITYAKDSGYVPNCIEFTSRGQSWD
jgi:hypothetical protein